MMESIECTCGATNSRTNLQKKEKKIKNLKKKKKTKQKTKQLPHFFKWNSIVYHKIRSNPQN